MPILPSAHASQAFGGRRVDFFAVPGEAAAAERPRASLRRFRDDSGQYETLKLADPRLSADPGEAVTVLRVQTGPNRRSLPAALVNHARGEWAYCKPAGSRLLARAGVSRGANWMLAMLALTLSALAAAWPYLAAVAAEISPALRLPAFDIMAFIAAQAPFLTGLDPAGFLPAAARNALSAVLPAAAHGPVLAGLALGVLALITFWARSWRIIWVPAFILAALAAGLMLGAASPASVMLAALGGGAALFLIGGFANRSRDRARLEARIAMLCEHLLRHPPEERVSSPSAISAASLAAPAAVLAARAEQREHAPDTNEPEPAASEAEADAEPAPEADASDASDAADLPSDAELAAARAAAGAEAGEAAGDEAPRQHRAPETVEPAAGHPSRDIALPEPPPMPAGEESAAADEARDAGDEPRRNDAAAGAGTPDFDDPLAARDHDPLLAEPDDPMLADDAPAPEIEPGDEEPEDARR